MTQIVLTALHNTLHYLRLSHLFLILFNPWRHSLLICKTDNWTETYLFFNTYCWVQYLNLLPLACDLGKHFQDFSHSFSVYGLPSGGKTIYFKTTRKLFGVRNGSENKACFWIISPLKASKWSQITFCILSNVLSCISERFCLNFEQINIPPRPAPSSFLDRIFN